MWRRRRGKQDRAGEGEHRQAMDDLQVKDEQIDGLLSTADELVREFRVTVDQASARLRGGVGKNGGRP